MVIGVVPSREIVAIRVIMVMITILFLSGSQNGLFDGPEGIACDDEDNILVSDFHNHRVQIFDANGGFVSAFGTFGEDEGSFKNPCGIAVTKDGSIIVVDSGNNRIQIF